MHLVFTELLLARAVLARSIKVLGWQPEAPKFREHDFPKKIIFFFEIQRTIDTSMVLYPSEIMHMVFAEHLLARAVFAKSIKVRGWQPEAPKFREHDFPKKIIFFFEIQRTIDTSMVLYPSEIMHMVFAEHLLARAVFAKSIKVRGWQPEAPKSREQDVPKKKRPFFEIHRTIDNTMGSVDLCNHAFGFYRTFTSQGSVGKVN